MITRAWKVYGIYDGERQHRQRASFLKSCTFTDATGAINEMECADKTGTNLYVIARITAETAEKCQNVLDGQISDGFFENCNVGFVEEIEA